jgi:hypothetical protein
VQSLIAGQAYELHTCVDVLIWVGVHRECMQVDCKAAETLKP